MVVVSNGVWSKLYFLCSRMYLPSFFCSFKSLGNVYNCSKYLIKTICIVIITVQLLQIVMYSRLDFAWSVISKTILQDRFGGVRACFLRALAGISPGGGWRLGMTQKRRRSPHGTRGDPLVWKKVRSIDLATPSNPGTGGDSFLDSFLTHWCFCSAGFYLFCRLLNNCCGNG